MKVSRNIIQLVVGLAVLGVAVGIGWILMKTRPYTEAEVEQQASKIVQVVELEPGNEMIRVSAWGTVIPAREVSIQPQVGGRIIDLHEQLVPGGRLREKEELLRIEAVDYEIALAERIAEKEEAVFEMEVEEGRQVIARREWEQLRGELGSVVPDSSLALREPHLDLSKAMLERADSAIRRARLDLDRTVVRAPFNGMIVEESVEIGQVVEPGRTVCRLVGTDRFWVRATLPMSDLKRIKLPGEGKPGATANIFLDTGNGSAESRDGIVVRLLADLETAGRMARLIIAVDDPLSREAIVDGETRILTPLLLGSYVRVEIEAGRLENVLAVPRLALREGDRLWLVGNDNRVRIAEPEILWTRGETVLVNNVLLDGERLVVSRLRTALPGMLVSPQQLQSRSRLPSDS